MKKYVEIRGKYMENMKISFILSSPFFSNPGTLLEIREYTPSPTVDDVRFEGIASEKTRPSPGNKNMFHVHR